MRRASVVPFRRRRRRRWRRPPEGARAALIWAGLIAFLSLGYGLGAPALDDWRSAHRPMTAGCRVAQVLDGDTLELVCPGRGRLRGRIVGYDAPELFSPRCRAEHDAALRAKRALATWARTAPTTEVAFLGRDDYGRALVDIRLGGRRVAQAMVASGNGRRYLGGHRGGWCGGVW